MQLQFSPNGVTVIRGENGTGKSHIIDAYCWLLTGVDTDDRTNFNLFDKHKEFTYENAIPAIVKATFEIDGIEYTFMRSAKQKWTRPRNKAEYVKDKSDEYKYYIDDLELSANDYKNRVSEIFMDVEKLKLVTNIRAIQGMEWKKLRKHFADMVGEISENELKGNYSSIQPLLDKYGSSENVKEKLSQGLAPLKKQEKEIEADIKALKALLPDLSQCDSAQAQIEEKKQRIVEINEEIIGIGEANKPLIEQREKESQLIAEKEREISSARTQYNLISEDLVNDAERELRKAKNQYNEIAEYNRNIQQKIANIDRDIKSAQSDVEYLKEEREDLIAKKEKTKAMEFEGENCPHCHQPLPFEMVNEARSKFYEWREKEVKSIVKKGQSIRARKDERILRLEELKREKESIVKKEQIDLTQFEEEVVNAKAKVKPFEETEQYKGLMEQLEVLKTNRTEIPESDTSELRKESSRLVTDIEYLSRIVSRRDDYDKGIEKINGKQEELRLNGIAKAKLEGTLDKVMEREREWASIIRTRANKYLKKCHVEMTELSKSGELYDICSVSIDGVDINTTINTANKVIAGVDIAQAFMTKYDVQMPIIIDNAEQITSPNLPECSGQLIVMYVDENYKELTML